ncbi:M7GpppX diphosphatase-like [Oopsacas minuta]|uniref:m7GpppX diphosphatase n=1 Tax=Oopsacas minuta TaxID=111878 RepID=A0AAV7KL70_9METZ|nr:M7GpppX diphosphatase-like [Oopsacas minuta]
MASAEEDVKKIKITPEGDSNNDIIKNKNSQLIDLSKFLMTSVLNQLSRSKDIFILGKFCDQPEGEQAIVLINKDTITGESLVPATFENISLSADMGNDIYEKYIAKLPVQLSGGKITVIRPATEQHIRKYSAQLYGFIHETPEMYQKITKQFIEEKSLSHNWVYNILEDKSEADRVLCRDNDPSIGFVLMPDLKWDITDKTTLYLLAIVMRRDIKSIRDLTKEHLPLLKNIRSKSLAFITEKWGYSQREIRSYIHYQPSYYHFHVHITFCGYEAPGTHVGKAHLLEDVIDNIELVSEFYSRKTLSFIYPTTHPLFTALTKTSST